MKLAHRSSWIVVAIVTAITLFFAAQLPKSRFDNDVFNFIPKTDPARLAVSEMTDTYGSQVSIVVGLESESGDIFTPRRFRQMQELTDRFSKLDNVSSVMGILSTEDIRAEGEDILVDSLVPEGFSGSPAGIAEVKQKILSWDMYRRTLVSDDFSSTQIVISLDAVIEDSSTWKGNIDPKRLVYLEVKDAIAATDLEGFKVYISGMPVFTVLLNDSLRKDLTFLVPLVAIVVIVTLLVSFRRLGGLLLPLVTVLVSTVWTMGLMALLGAPLSLLSTVVPVLMMAVGSAYGIHIISHYYDELDACPSHPSPEENEKLVKRSLAKVSWPVTLAALTTLAGFASNAITNIVPMQVFGIYSSFGVLAAFGIALTFIPALLTIRGALHEKHAATPKAGAKSRGSLGLVDLIERGLTRITSKPKTVVAVSILILIVSIWGTSRVIVDNAIIEYFKDYTEISRADRFMREKFNGTKVFSFVIKGGAPGSLTDPDILGAMDGLATYLEGCSPDVGKVISYTQFIKRINQVFNIDEPATGIVRASSVTRAVSPSPSTAAPEEEPAFGFGDMGTAADEPAFGFDMSAPAPASVREAKPAPAEAKPATVSLDLLNAAFARSGSATPTPEQWLAQINKAANFQGAAYYEIPTDPARYGMETKEDLSRLISNYLVFVGEGTTGFANDPLEPSEALITVQTRSKGNIGLQDIVDKGLAWARLHFPEGSTVIAAGPAIVEKSITDSIIGNQVLSIIVSLGAVFIILAVFYRSLAAGLIGLIPLSISILFNFCIMGFLGIKLNISTAIVASLAIGIGIDYTIHYISAYRHERMRTADLALVKERAIRSSGRAIMFNALAVGAGFAVLAASQFRPLMNLGSLIALTMATSSFAALIIIPVVLDLTKPAFLVKPLWFETGAGQGDDE